MISFLSGTFQHYYSLLKCVNELIPNYTQIYRINSCKKQCMLYYTRMTCGDVLSCFKMLKLLHWWLSLHLHIFLIIDIVTRFCMCNILLLSCVLYVHVFNGYSYQGCFEEELRGHQVLFFIVILASEIIVPNYLRMNVTCMYWLMVSQH